NFRDNLLSSTFIYATRFIQNNGLIQREQVLTVLLISAITAVKFWIDVGDVDLAKIAQIAGIPKEEMLGLERTFLRTLNYSLFLQPNEIQAWSALAIPVPAAC